MNLSKELIPWTCHVCGRAFDTPGGGICARCNKETCQIHLNRFGNGLIKDAYWVCDNCLTAEEKTKSKTAAGKAAQFGLETRHGFLRDREPLSSKGKPEGRRLLGPHHPAFVPVDLYLENPLKESADTFHHAISGALRLHQYDEIIGIPCKLMPPSLQLPVEVIQKDIAQEGRKRPALWHSFGRFIQPAVYDNTGPKIPADQTEDAFVADSPGDPVHQDIVVDRIEELLKVDIHSIGIAVLDQPEYLLYGLMRRTVRSEPETRIQRSGDRKQE
jgi:hypothetical protein